MRGIHWVILAVGALGLGLLLLDHWAHPLGLLPYLVLLACPFLHLVHRRRGGHRHRGPQPARKEGTS